jgi:N-acetylmuramoyl-L-alanine amidase
LLALWFIPWSVEAQEVLSLRYTDRPEQVQVLLLTDSQGRPYIPLVDAAKFYGVNLDFDSQTGRITLSKGAIQAKLVLYQSLFLATDPTESFLIDPVELISGQLAITPESAEDLFQVVLDQDVQFLPDQKTFLVGFVPDDEGTPGSETPTPTVLAENPPPILPTETPTVSEENFLASTQPTLTPTPEVSAQPSPVITIVVENPPSALSPETTVGSPSSASSGDALENIEELPEDSQAENEEESSNAGPGDQVRRIIIDPGHGGVDRGATGYDGSYFEKQATLSIARKVAALLQQHPGLEVFLTRDGDYYISLKYRTTFANRHKADLFVSIHCNSNPNRGSSAHGTEIYVYSNKASNVYAAVAAVRENDKRDYLDLTLNDLYNRGFRKRSFDLANLIHDRIQGSLRQHMRKIDTAPFYVLARVNMPSILIETAFISNPSEEQKLENDSWQDRMAQAIAGGILDYKRRVEGNGDHPQAGL